MPTIIIHTLDGKILRLDDGFRMCCCEEDPSIIGLWYKVGDECWNCKPEDYAFNVFNEEKEIGTGDGSTVRFPIPECPPHMYLELTWANTESNVGPSIGEVYVKDETQTPTEYWVYYDNTTTTKTSFDYHTVEWNEEESIYELVTNLDYPEDVIPENYTIYADWTCLTDYTPKYLSVKITGAFIGVPDEENPSILVPGTITCQDSDTRRYEISGSLDCEIVIKQEFACTWGNTQDLSFPGFGDGENYITAKEEQYTNGEWVLNNIRYYYLKHCQVTFTSYGGVDYVRISLGTKAHTDSNSRTHSSDLEAIDMNEVCVRAEGIVNWDNDDTNDISTWHCSENPEWHHINNIYLEVEPWPMGIENCQICEDSGFSTPEKIKVSIANMNRAEKMLHRQEITWSGEDNCSGEVSDILYEGSLNEEFILEQDGANKCMWVFDVQDEDQSDSALHEQLWENESIYNYLKWTDFQCTTDWEPDPKVHYMVYYREYRHYIKKISVRRLANQIVIFRLETRTLYRNLDDYGNYSGGVSRLSISGRDNETEEFIENVTGCVNCSANNLINDYIFQAEDEGEEYLGYLRNNYNDASYKIEWDVTIEPYTG